MLRDDRVVSSESASNKFLNENEDLSPSLKSKTESSGLFTEPQLARSNLNGLSANFRTAGAARPERLIAGFIAMCKQRVYENKKKKRKREREHIG